MPLYELRTYTLKTPEAAKAYAAIWDKHIPSLKKFGIVTCGVWTPQDNASEVLALVTYEDGIDGASAGRAFMGSADFKADMEGFDMSTIAKVVPRLLTAVSSSPMQ